MLNKKRGYISTYNKEDFFNNWEEINKDLGRRWDRVVKCSPHKELKKPTLTDRYFAAAIIRVLKKILPSSKKLKILKFDLYNEATMTATLADWFIADKKYDYYGVDISKEVVKLARKNFKNRIDTAHFRVGDIRKLPFKKNSFDVVFSFGTIEHIRENQQAVQEAFRVLKPGGIFITGVNNKLDIWFSYFVNEFTNHIFKHITSYEASHFPWEQKRWLIKAGFERVTVTGMIMLPHIIRYADLFVEWSEINGVIKFLWDNALIKPLIKMAELLDRIDHVRLIGMHTTAFGYKPKHNN